jgi:hypothetical protein
MLLYCIINQAKCQVKLPIITNKFKSLITNRPIWNAFCPIGTATTKGRSALDQRALGIRRHIFGWHFTFPIAQPRDARAL